MSDKEQFTPYAYGEVAAFYAEWPGGLDEVEAAIRTWREKAQKLEKEMAAERMRLDLVTQHRDALMNEVLSLVATLKEIRDATHKPAVVLRGVAGYALSSEGKL